MDENNHSSPINESTFPVPRGFKTAVELLMLTLYFSKTLLESVIVNLLEFSTCVVVLKYNATNCTTAATDPTTGSQLQQSAANLVLARYLIEACIPTVLTLFIGPWSDTNGRRPLILFAIAGYTISSMIICALTLVPGVHPVYLVLSSLPVALGGGATCFYMALYCYLSDITEFKQRAFRMGLLTGACYTGRFLGTVAAPYLLQTSEQYGFTIVYSTTSTTLLVTLLYAYLVVPESIKIIQSERTKLWRLNHVKEIFKTCLKPRRNRYIKTVILIIIMNLGIFELLLEGERAVLYLYTQKQFKWDLLDFTRYSSFVVITAGASLIVNTWFFTSVLTFSDVSLMFVSSLCLLFKSLMQAVASTFLFLYEASGFSMIAILILPLSRSQLSKLIPNEDLGKIFAFTAFVEAVVPVAASPLYTIIFKSTLDTVPNAVFWLSTCLSGSSVILIGLAGVLLSLSSEEELRPLL